MAIRNAQELLEPSSINEFISHYLEKISRFFNTTVKHPRGVEFTWFKSGEEIRVVCGGTINLPTKGRKLLGIY